MFVIHWTADRVLVKFHNKIKMIRVLDYRTEFNDIVQNKNPLKNSLTRGCDERCQTFRHSAIIEINFKIIKSIPKTKFTFIYVHLYID